MPSIYSEGEYDISGTIVGIVDKEKIIDGKKISKNDVLIGLPSNGLHTNGYSLARAVLLKKYNVDTYFEELGETLGDSLLKIHQSYLKSIYHFIEENLIHGISHITGGGILGNTNRIIPDGFKIKIDWDSWKVPPIFNLIQKTGNITDEEMRKVFNLGIGMILVVSKNNADRVLSEIGKQNAFVIGEVV
jgi:phosphoribosylformylglycinamidine cyclo-ligase